jgi:hypothetical protein
MTFDDIKIDVLKFGLARYFIFLKTKMPELATTLLFPII